MKKILLRRQMNLKIFLFLLIGSLTIVQYSIFLTHSILYTSCSSKKLILSINLLKIIK